MVEHMEKFKILNVPPGNFCCIPRPRHSSHLTGWAPRISWFMAMHAEPGLAMPSSAICRFSNHWTGLEKLLPLPMAISWLEISSTKLRCTAKHEVSVRVKPSPPPTQGTVGTWEGIRWGLVGINCPRRWGDSLRFWGFVWQSSSRWGIAQQFYFGWGLGNFASSMGGLDISFQCGWGLDW